MLTRSFRSTFNHHLHFRSVSTAVFTWGNGSKVGLGIKDAKAELSPRRLVALDEYDIAQVSAGESHSAAVTKDGRLLTWGNGKYGVLGHGDETQVVEPKVVDSLEGVSIVQVDCGLYHTVALSADGDVFTWGWGGSFMSGQGALGLGDSEQQCYPCLVERLSDNGIKIKQISSGNQHILALGEDNIGYSWGLGEKGRLGDGNVSDSRIPLSLDAFPDSAGEISSIEAGGAFSLTIMNDSQHVYAWGANGASELGLPVGFDVQNAMESFPALIKPISPLEDGSRINKIFGGYDSSMALTDTGKVLVWGGKLWAEPHEVETLIGLKAVTGAVGSRVNAVITESGSLYTWGKGRTMMLGHGDKSARTVPERVSTDPIEIEKETKEIKLNPVEGGSFKSISLGTYHAISIVEFSD